MLRLFESAPTCNKLRAFRLLCNSSKDGRSVKDRGGTVGNDAVQKGDSSIIAEKQKSSFGWTITQSRSVMVLIMGSDYKACVH